MIDNIAQNAAGIQIEIFDGCVGFSITYILPVCLTVQTGGVASVAHGAS
jgi:hypothetical protein